MVFENLLIPYSNKPLIQYALEDFKHIFGTVGEEVLASNLIEDEEELLKGTAHNINPV